MPSLSMPPGALKKVIKRVDVSNRELEPFEWSLNEMGQVVMHTAVKDASLVLVWYFDGDQPFGYDMYNSKACKPGELLTWWSHQYKQLTEHEGKSLTGLIKPTKES